MKYISSSIGHEITAVLHGVDKKLINDHKFLKKVILEGLENDDFTILKEVDHKFNPHGYTLTVLLAESHVCIHTYPEHDSIYFNLYSCKGKNHGKKTYGYFIKMLKPEKIDVNMRDVVVGK